jgi:uncharacterized protein
MAFVRVEAIYVYPVKSLRGIRLNDSTFGSRGLTFDRRWMVVDGSGAFLSQRSHPKMATIRTCLDSDVLMLYAGTDSVTVPTDFAGRPGVVRVWKTECLGNYVGEPADRVLSDWLGVQCHLVAMPDTTERKPNSPFAWDGDRVGFADSSPILVVGTGSLGDLNARLDRAVPMERFRPNLVIDGTTPWEEDGWRTVELAGSEFHFLKRCGRCIMTTLDHETGERQGEEPLRTLAKFRHFDGNVCFGSYFAAGQPGSVRVGDEVVVKEKTPLD